MTQRLHIEIVEHTVRQAGQPLTGIGRYTQEIINGLGSIPDTPIDLTLTRTIPPPLSNRFTPLRAFPIGIQAHQARSIAHFMQIVGCSLMLWRPVRPAVATVHDLGVLVCKADEPLFNGFERWILDRQFEGLRRMDWFVADSHATAKSLVDVLGVKAKQVNIMHLGVDHTHFKPIPEARQRVWERFYPIPDGGMFDLLYVGSELPRKNLGVLLEAVAILRQQDIPVRLIKVGGSGGERWREAFKTQIAKLKLEEVVIIVDKVSEADLPLLYNATDLFVTTSLLEGFGLPALEAMACGTPVICSDAGSLPEIVGDAGILINPQDPNAIANRIREILDDSDKRHDMRERGLEQAAKFTWNHAITDLINLYKTIGA